MRTGIDALQPVEHLQSLRDGRELVLAALCASTTSVPNACSTIYSPAPMPVCVCTDSQMTALLAVGNRLQIQMQYLPALLISDAKKGAI